MPSSNFILNPNKNKKNNDLKLTKYITRFYYVCLDLTKFR